MGDTVLYLFLVQMSLFAIGAGAIAVGLLIKYRPPFWGAYVATKAGAASIVAIILIRVLPVQRIPNNPWAWAYVTGVAAIAVGMTGVARDLAKRFGRSS